MKRDLDLIRKIVLAVEDGPTGFARHMSIEDYSGEEIGYHNYLIINSGLAEGFEITAHGDTSPQWQISNLTSAGHDFADAARSETTWKRATEVVKRKAGGITLELLKQLLFSIVRGQLGL